MAYECALETYVKSFYGSSATATAYKEATRSVIENTFGGQIANPGTAHSTYSNDLLVAKVDLANVTYTVAKSGNDDTSISPSKSIYGASESSITVNGTAVTTSSTSVRFVKTYSNGTTASFYPDSITYQWQVDGSNVSASGQNYTFTWNTAGTTVESSNPTKTVKRRVIYVFEGISYVADNWERCTVTRYANTASISSIDTNCGNCADITVRATGSTYNTYSNLSHTSDDFTAWIRGVTISYKSGSTATLSSTILNSANSNIRYALPSASYTDSSTNIKFDISYKFETSSPVTWLTFNSNYASFVTTTATSSRSIAIYRAATFTVTIPASYFSGSGSLITGTVTTTATGSVTQGASSGSSYYYSGSYYYGGTGRYVYIYKNNASYCRVAGNPYVYGYNGSSLVVAMSLDTVIDSSGYLKLDMGLAITHISGLKWYSSSTTSNWTLVNEGFATSGSPYYIISNS